MKIHKRRSVSLDETPEILLSSKQNKHWKTLRNVFAASVLLKTHEVESVEDLSVLLRNVARIPTNKAYRKKKEIQRSNSPTSVALAQHRRDQTLFKIIEQGDTRELPHLEELIENDPKKYLRDSNKPNSFINQKNLEGCTPLYIASRNGSLDFVKFLLDVGADWNIKSENSNESCLEAASRWGHYQVVKLLLKKPWNEKDVKQAVKVSTGNVKELLKDSKNKKNKKKCRMCFFG